MTFFLSAALGTWLDQAFAGFDQAVFQFFGNIQNEILNVISLIFTAMGSTIYVVLFAIFGLVLIFFRRTRKYGIALVAAIVIGTLLTNIVFKPLFQRIRPYNTLQHMEGFLGWYKGAGMLAESDYCFPSGHTTGATEIGVALCLCFASNKKWKYFWIPPVIAILVGLSRIYLMVHYATDVCAGWIIGIIAGTAGFFIAKALTGFLKKRSAAKQSGKAARRSNLFTAKQLALTCIAAWLVIFAVGFISVISEKNSDDPRCAYNGDYQCYNFAETNNKKYPAIDGEYYCKIHWKELNP